MEEIKFTLPISPVTKKNHGQIIHIRGGRHVMLPSKQYIAFEKEALKYIQQNIKIETIDYPINLKAIFYKPTRRSSDLVNYLQALQDTMVNARIIIDDNTKIVESVDGSRVEYDKDNPRIEVTIERKEDV